MSNLFQKYPSARNDYAFDRTEYENYLLDGKFIVEDKIDGANIGLRFGPDASLHVMSRNQCIGRYPKLSNFYCINEVLERDIWQEFIAFYMNKAQETQRLMYFYCELYGPSVINRIDYGTNNLAIFDMKTDINCDEWMLPIALREMLDKDGFKDLIVPDIIICNGLDSALSINPIFRDPILNKEGNLSEGIVIKSYDRRVFSYSGERLCIKKKNPDFAEGNFKHKKIDIPKTTPDWLIEAMSKYQSYINENRILSYFSKNGPIQNRKQIGDYITGINADAFEDFQRDFDLVCTNSDRRTIVGSGSKKVLDFLLKTIDK